MSDSLPIVWATEPHTRAKHEILGEYLAAWMPILAAGASARGDLGSEIKYVDGFAGPGNYTGGEVGSPIVAIRTALGRKSALPVPVRFILIEQDAARCQRLGVEIRKVIRERGDPGRAQVDEPLQGDCASELNRILDETERAGRPFGPAMVFLDQFGYSDVPITLIGRLLAHTRCEVLSYLNWDHLNRFITDSKKHAGITGTFGSEQWKAAVPLDPARRQSTLRSLYETALRSIGAEYVIPFSMYDANDKLLYWLFFCTNHLLGVEVMKKAMRKVDESGSFRFSDIHGPGQPQLISGYTQDWLAQHLLGQLDGRTMTGEQVKEFVLAKTPCYLFKPALSALEASHRLVIESAPPGRARGKFPDHMLSGLVLRFTSAGKPGSQTHLFGA